jgi:hypothetical protein
MDLFLARSVLLMSRLAVVWSEKYASAVGSGKPNGCH